MDNIRACVFDAYGTLFDFASAAASCPDVPAGMAPALTTMWRDKQLQYAWLRSLQGQYADFWQVTRDALDYALDALEVRQPGLADRLMDLYLALDTFPEVPQVLRDLKAAGITTAILSNGTPAMLAAIVDRARLAPALDAVFSVDRVRVYKTAHAVYQMAVDELGVATEAICFVSSNGWDAYAASAFGMRVVWCNRYGQRPERLPGRPDRMIRTLAELPAILCPPDRA